MPGDDADLGRAVSSPNVPSNMPRWMDDTESRRRVLGIYRDYLRGVPVDALCDKYNTSPATVYRDLRRARSEARHRYLENFTVALAERVEARRALIREAREMMLEVDMAAVSPRVKFDARFRLMQYISEQETVIDTLIGARRSSNGKDGLPTLGEMAQPLNGTAVVVIAGASGVRGEPLVLADDNIIEGIVLRRSDGSSPADPAAE